MTTVTGVTAITLDLDDTLWAIGPVIARAERALADWLGRRHPGVRPHLDGESIAGLRSAVLAEFADRSHDLTFVRREVIARLGHAAGCRIEVDAAFEVFERARNDLELFPDVRPALASLKARFRLIALTNGNASLERIGIDDLFDGFVSARSAGAAKPSPRIFEAALRAAGAPAAGTLHVGDHPELDVQAARGAGLRAVWVNRSGADWPDGLDAPDVVVRDLHELDRLLGAA